MTIRGVQVDWAIVLEANRSVCGRLPGDMAKALRGWTGAAADSIVVTVHSVEER